MKNLLILSFLALTLLASPSRGCAGESIFRLEIPLEKGADVTATRPDGETFSLGKVLALPTKSRWPSYTASKWGKPGSVVASAVNACHLLLNVEKGGGRTLSLLPGKTVAPAAGPGAAVVIDSPAGVGIFGGWAPPVGTSVQILSEDGMLRPLNADTPPRPGEHLIMEVSERPGPYMVDIENREGGAVTAWYDGLGAVPLATVVRPVGGVGRFGGSAFQDVSRLRANHPGVVCISTSSRGEIGGFQILPWEHAHSPEMSNAWKLTQWLIIRPQSGRLEGRSPLFSGFLLPGTAPDEKLWDLWSTYGRRPLILGRFHNGPLKKLPVRTGRDDTALDGLTHLRIYFPFTKEPQKP